VPKWTAKTVGIVKANRFGDGIHRRARVRWPLARLVKPEALHKSGGTAIELQPESAGELPRAKIDMLCHCFGGKPISALMGTHTIFSVSLLR
jgi:hypothetical protein